MSDGRLDWHNDTLLFIRNNRKTSDEPGHLSYGDACYAFRAPEPPIVSALTGNAR